MIPESKNGVALFFQPRRSVPVLEGLIEMVSTIQFHDQAMLETAKIHNKRPKWLLPAKLRTNYFAITEMSP